MILQKKVTNMQAYQNDILKTNDPTDALTYDVLLWCQNEEG